MDYESNRKSEPVEANSVRANLKPNFSSAERAGNLSALADAGPAQDEMDMPSEVDAWWSDHSASELLIAEDIIRSLTYEGISSRYHGIVDPYPGTFHWFLEENLASREPNAKGGALPVWLESGSGVFWMTGKLGSGKSTATKFILNQRRTQDLLAAWASPERSLVAHHFFNGSGTDLQRSAVGFLRSILHQMFSQDPSLMYVAAPHRLYANYEDKFSRWEVDELTQTLLRLTVHEGLSSHICIFVDGIDEMDGDFLSFTDLLQELVKSPRVKLFLSCRYLNIFQDAFGPTPSLCLQDLTHNDIGLFIEGRLLEFVDEHRAQGTSREIAITPLVERTLEKANGIFLYAALASGSLQDGIMNFDSQGQLLRRLGKLPEQFADLFRRMLASIEPVYLQQAARFLKIAVLADGHQRLMMYELMNDKGIWKGSTGPMTREDFYSMQELLQRRITSRCCGLLEVQADSHPDRMYQLPPKVVLLHRTLKDFLLQPDIQEFLDRNAPTFDMHAALIQGYTTLIVSMPIDGLSSQAFLSVTHIFLESIGHLITNHAAKDDSQLAAEVRPLLESYANVIWRFQIRGGELDWQNLLRDVFFRSFCGGNFDLIQLENMTLEIAKVLELQPTIQNTLTEHAEKSVGDDILGTKNAVNVFSNEDGHASAVTDISDEASEGSFRSDARPGYAQSVFSSGTIASSMTAPSSHGLIQSAREMLVEFMLEDVDLGPLFKAAAEDQNIGVKRLKRNLQRLLVKYSKSLSYFAEGDVQHEAARLVMSSSTYVSHHICEIVGNAQSTKPLSIFAIEDISQKRSYNEEKVRRFLDDIQDPCDSSAHLDIDAASTITHELEDDTDTESDVDEQVSGEILDGNLIQVKLFLRSGPPFERLRRGLGRFVMPHAQFEEKGPKDLLFEPNPVSKVILDASSDKQALEEWAMDYPDLPSLVDRLLKIILPSHREPAVPPGARRIRWQCSCGAHLFDDFWESRHGALDELEAHLHQHDPASTPSRHQNIISWMKKCLHVFVTPINMIFMTLRSVSASKTSSLPLHGVRTQPAQGSNATQDQYLLLCIDKGEIETKLFHHLVAGVDTDRKLFQALREDVHKRRDLRNWFTLKSINRLSLSKFVVDESDFTENILHDCQQECVCLPPEHLVGDDRDYHCHPAPKEDPGYAPAIGPCRLTHYFHCPDGPRVNQRSILHQLPKRNRRKLQATDLEVIEGWGIHFEVGWHWRTIYFIVVVVLTFFSLVFGIVWSITKGDVSGAFAISGFWLNLGSLLVGYLALRSK